MGCCSCSSNRASHTLPSINEIHPVVESYETLSVDSEVILSQVPEYKLNIHYRAAVLSDGFTKVEKSITGHFFISLEKNGERFYFGKYPKGGGPIKTIFGSEKIESKKEADYVLCLKQFEIRDNQKYLDTKTIKLSEEQYSRAFEYAKSKSEGKIATKMYVLGLADCADFVQSVYNAAGLPLYFSSAYRRKELILSLAGRKVLTAYGCLDKFVSKFAKIYASNRKKLATKLNVHEELIIALPEKIFFVDIDDALQRIMKQQDIYESKDNKIFIYNLRVENMFNLVKVNLREQYDFRLSKVGELLVNKIAQYKWDSNEIYKAKVKKRKQSLKDRLDNYLNEANVKLANYEAEVKEAKAKGVVVRNKKKIKKLKTLIKKKSDQKESLEKYFEEKFKCQVKTKMLVDAKRQFGTIYNHLNQYKVQINKLVTGLIDIGDDDKISLYSIRLKLEQISKVLLENTSQKVEKMIIHDFEIFFNTILLKISTDGRKQHKNSLKYFLNHKITTKLWLKSLKMFRKK